MPHKRSKARSDGPVRRLTLHRTTEFHAIAGPVGAPLPPFPIPTQKGLRILPKGAHFWMVQAHKAQAAHRHAIRAARQPESGLVPTAEELQELLVELSGLWSGDGEESSGSSAS